MPEEGKRTAPPYVAFKTFTNFADRLSEGAMPARIDGSVMNTLAGGTQGQLISALKSLGFIEDGGVPSASFQEYVSGDAATRRRIMRSAMDRAYDFLLANPSINIETATAAQFDELVQQTFGSKGSTIDKIAAFFIAASDHGGLRISEHLKSRPTRAAGGSASRRQRKPKSGEDSEKNSSSMGKETLPPEVPGVTPTAATLWTLWDPVEMTDQEQSAVITLMQYLKRREAEE